MELKKKVIVVDDTEFEVREISIGAVLPILPRLEQSEEQQEAQMEIIEKCLFKDGAVVSPEDVRGLSMRVYLKIAEAVMSINGLDERREGKD